MVREYRYAMYNRPVWGGLSLSQPYTLDGELTHPDIVENRRYYNRDAHSILITNHPLTADEIRKLEMVDIAADNKQRAHKAELVAYINTFDDVPDSGKGALIQMVEIGKYVQNKADVDKWADKYMSQGTRSKPNPASSQTDKPPIKRFDEEGFRIRMHSKDWRLFEAANAANAKKQARNENIQKQEYQRKKGSKSYSHINLASCNYEGSKDYGSGVVHKYSFVEIMRPIRNEGTPKAPAANLPPALTAPPELTADVLGKNLVEAVLISGKTYPQRREIGSLGGKWKSEKTGWVVPISNRAEAERLAEAHGFDIDITTVEPIDLETPTGDRLRGIRQDKLDTKRERWQNKITRLESEYAAIEKGLEPYSDWAFITQPILVGHHSEKAHRNLRDRISKKMDRKVEIYTEIKELKRKLQVSSGGVRMKGDTEIIRQLQRKEQDTIIQKGTMVYDVLYSRNAIVARVNKKTYTLQSVDGLKFTHDKTWVNRLDDQTVPQNLIQYAGTKKKPAVKKPAPAPDLPPALTAPPELTADVLGVGQPPTPTAAPKPKAALTPAQIALHGYGYVPPPPALTAPPERTAGMYGAGAASTVTENIEQLERRTGRKYPRTKKELEAHQTWNVEITRGTKTFMGKSEPQVTVYTKIPGMGHPGIGTNTALAIWDFCNKNKLPPLPKKQPTTVAPGRKPTPAPNLPPALTAPPELTADVLGAGQPPTPTAAPKARKPAARKPAPAPNLPPILTAPPPITEEVKGVTHKPKYKVGDLVYSYQNPTVKRPIRVVRNALETDAYHHSYIISLKSGAGTKDSNNIAEQSISKTPQKPVYTPPAQAPKARKPAPAPNLPPALTAPPELTADVFGTGPMGLTPTPAAPKARKPKARKPKTKVAAAPKAKPKATKPKAKKTAAAPKLTAAQREHLAIQGFVMVKRGGKYVKITR